LPPAIAPEAPAASMTIAAVAASAREIFGIYDVSLSVFGNEGFALISQRRVSRPIVQRWQEMRFAAVSPGTGGGLPDASQAYAFRP